MGEVDSRGVKRADEGGGLLLAAEGQDLAFKLVDFVKLSARIGKKTAAVERGALRA